MGNRKAEPFLTLYCSTVHACDKQPGHDEIANTLEEQL